MMLLTLPGTATTYYSEEIGMLNINITQDQVQEPAGRYDVVNIQSIEELPSQLSVLMSTVQMNNVKSVSKLQIQTEPGEGLLIEFLKNMKFNQNHKDQCYISEKACYLGALSILYKC